MKGKNFNLVEEGAARREEVYAPRERETFIERVNGSDGGLKKRRMTVSVGWVVECREHTLDERSFTNLHFHSHSPADGVDDELKGGKKGWSWFDIGWYEERR